MPYNYPSDLWEDPKEDASNNANVNLNTLIAGEDLTNNVMKVEQRFSYQSLVSLVTVVAKNGAGFLHSVVISALSTPTIELYDNTAASGALIGRIAANVPPATYTFNVNFATGLTINPQPGGIIPTATIIYR